MAGAALGASPLGLALGRWSTRPDTRAVGTRASGRSAETMISGVRPQALALSIQGGLVFTGGALRRLCVGVGHDGRIRLSETPLPAERVLDATDRVVAPGFIDILGDNSS